MAHFIAMNGFSTFYCHEWFLQWGYMLHKDLKEFLELNKWKQIGYRDIWSNQNNDVFVINAPWHIWLLSVAMKGFSNEEMRCHNDLKEAPLILIMETYRSHGYQALWETKMMFVITFRMDSPAILKRDFFKAKNVPWNCKNRENRDFNKYKINTRFF